MANPLQGGDYSSFFESNRYNLQKKQFDNKNIEDKKEYFMKNNIISGTRDCISISFGHSFNHSTGEMEKLVNGKFVPLE